VLKSLKKLVMPTLATATLFLSQGLLTTKPANAFLGTDPCNQNVNCYDLRERVNYFIRDKSGYCRNRYGAFAIVYWAYYSVPFCATPKGGGA
jgi:hypothetical protein